jgi:hypothetical protein
MNPPIELLGFYYSIVDMVKQIDNLVDFVSQHDEKYNSIMTDDFMNGLVRVDPDMVLKISQLLQLDDPKHRELLVAFVKRFIHSMGFEFLNMRCTLFLWDQVIMKVYPMREEMFFALGVMLQCLKPILDQAQTWDHFLDILYKNSKEIEFKVFHKNYVTMFKELNFYYPVYDNVDMGGMMFTQIDTTENLQQSQIIDETVKKPKDKKNSLPKLHSNLLKNVGKKSDPNTDDDTSSRKSDPRLEQAAKMNLVNTQPKFKEQEGMIPFVDPDEDGDDDDI